MEAKEVFTLESILPYLNEQNPYVYTAVGKKYIDKEKENASLGAFDSKLSLKYDDKDYPLSEGELLDVYVEKPIENGMEFLVGYRDAEGTQEYNNIKTGDDGEARIGIKVPVFSVLNDINERKLNLNSARLQSQNSKLNAINNFGLLYLQTTQAYYKLLHDMALLQLEKELYSAASQRMTFIKKRVEVGSLPRITLLEAQQQIINREQRVLGAENTYTNTFEILLNYLNISREHFNNNYELPRFSDLEKTIIDTSLAIQGAFDNRTELQVFKNKKSKLNLETRYTSLSKYPSLDFSVQAVHDFERDDDGVKFTFDMGFPIERRTYLGKSAQIKKSLNYLQMAEEKKKLSISTKIKQIQNSLHMTEKNINNSKIEIDLVEQLQKAESKKYSLGLSDLFRLNQREVYTIRVKKKLLAYRLSYGYLKEELKREMGEVPAYAK